MRNFIRRILAYLESRRKWNRTKRLLRERAEGELAVALYGNGMVRKHI
ncbi:MAG: hypothetical protein WA003_01190 [Desulfuromonadaceae bacterium]